MLELANGDAYSTPVKNSVSFAPVFLKWVLCLVFVPGTFGFVLALVQVHFFGYAAGFGWLVHGLGSNAAVNADGFQPPVTLFVRIILCPH